MPIKKITIPSKSQQLHLKNLSKTIQKTLMNCRSERYLIWAVLPIIESKLLRIIQQLLLFYVKNNIHPRQLFTFYRTQYPINHLIDNLPTLCTEILLDDFLVEFHPRWLVWHIFVLSWTDECDLLEFVESFLSTQTVHETLPKLLLVSQADLLYTGGFVPGVHKPETCLDVGTWLVKIA